LVTGESGQPTCLTFCNREQVYTELPVCGVIRCYFFTQSFPATM
jgi:hypothetical protein